MNRLADAHSPYLLQHKDNPVDWYPWGEEAFAKAEKEDKPVFLSIGYSTCHWCHVMEHESFEDEEVARLMNEAFVAIKVDREERPDIDHLYMTVCQMMTRQGGWPLNVLLTPDKKPFHAATYIPKEGRFGRMGMTQLVPRIQELWQNERERVLESANGITDTIRNAEASSNGEAGLEASVLDDAVETLSERFDAAHGGFGSAPKFPSPHTLLFLLRYADRTGSERALTMAQTTLDAMQRGGIRDHLGGGFHRYATDARWRVPHFEKMLYDQAMLAMAYTEAFQLTGAARYEQAARAIFEYVLRDLQAPEGGFYSAEDADSEGREGTFYLWTTDEIREVLGEEDAALVTDVYNLDDDGNFEDESTGRRTGENILYLEKPLAEIAAERGVDEADLRARLDAAHEKLFERREQRERPGLDDKILTDWNGLMIAALAKAGAAFDDSSLTCAAQEAASFVIERMRGEDGRLLHRYRGGDAAIRAQLDDYVFLAFGLLELYAATGDAECLDDALAVTEAQRDYFWDDARGGFFLTADDDEELLVRQKTFYDGAIPSGNSVALLSLLRLARLTGRTDLEDDAQRLAEAAAGGVRQQPAGFAALLVGLDFAFGSTREVVVVGEPAAEDTEAMLGALRRAYLPRAVTLFRPAGEEPTVSNLAPFTAEQRMVGEKATAYVCQDFQCQAPTNDLGEMLASLDGGPQTPQQVRGRLPGGGS